MVYRLCHKTDGGMKTVRDTHQDLAACFVWKQVGIGYLSLDSKLVEAWHVCCVWHHCGGRVEMKSKTDGSLRRAASESSTQLYCFLCIRP
jgi:hypothetical protein